VLGLVFALLVPPADVSAIRTGVSRIASPGVPGPIGVFGPDAVVVFDAKSDRGRLPVVAVSQLGHGKIVAFGHGGYLGAPDAGDTRRLLANAVRWSGGASATVYAPGNGGLQTALRGYGITVVTDGAGFDRLPRPGSVLIADAHALRPEQIPALRAYLQQGGHWVTSGLGWGWSQVNRRPVSELPANALLAEAGLVFTDGYLDPDENGLITTGEPMSFSHAGTALHALRSDRVANADAAVAAVRGVLDVLPGDHPFAQRVAAQVASRPQPAIGPGKPLAADAGADRLAVVWFDRHWPSLDPRAVPVHPSAALFPGAASGERTTVTASLPEGQWGYVGTGIYVPAGTVVRVRTTNLPPGAHLRVGAHHDQNWHHARWERFPRISHTYPLRDGRAEIAHPFGGLLYVEIERPVGVGASVVAENVLPAPLFRLGETTPEEWRRVRSAPGPWAEIEGERIIVLVPSEHIRNLDDPEAVAKFWDEVADHQADLAQVSQERPRRERLVPDAQISAGYMHAGYPIMTWMDVAAESVDAPRLRRDGNWGHYHELGHNLQNGDWTFGGTGEVTVNLFTLYSYDHVQRRRPGDRAFDDAACLATWEKFVASEPTFAKWQGDPFLALTMYAQMQNAFGWDAYKKVFREYLALPAGERPRNDAEKRDQWMVRFSLAVGKNLGPFFRAWRVPVTDAAQAKVAHLPVWLPVGMQAPVR